MTDPDIRPLSTSFAVTAQITPEDLKAIKAAGFNSVICNRPDDEEPGQPGFDSIRAAASELGLKTLFLPITHAGLSQPQVDEFDTALETLPAPILAYCRSGARSTMLWSHSSAGQSQSQQSA